MRYPNIQIMILTVAFSVSGCIQTVSDNVELNDTPDQDSSYTKAYDFATRENNIVVNFETRFTITASYLSPEFRAAFAKRFQKLFDSPQPFLEEASTKAGFFVTLYSPSQEGYDLTNDQLWTIQLKTEDKLQKPILIKRLDNKARWTPFFESVHQWSEEYLILFDTPSQSIDAKLVKKPTLHLQVANADAKIKLIW